MTFTKEQLQAVMTGTDLNHRVEALRQLLEYPVKEHDPQGSRFWYLRPGADELEAEETCPVAVGFYEELSGATDQEIKKFLTSKEQQQEIYGHYTNRVAEQQPVMYLLLPTKEALGRVPLVLPSEGGLRQRQIQTFDWNEPQLIARLNRLKQGELPIAVKGLSSVPLVEWVFYEPIKTAKELAQLLAEAARRIEQVIPQVYEKEKADGYLHHLLESFQRELLPTLKLTPDNEKDYSFADIYAQTIAYALFTARVFSYVRDKEEGREKKPTHFDRESAWQKLPETNPFLRKLFKDISERKAEELGDELIGAIAEIFGILRAAKMDAILSDFQMKMNREDIVIRFYEDFLTAYKPQMRERRGVYYTPEPIVSYIVRSVDHILKTDFKLTDGLADATKVKVEKPDKKGTTETHKVLITDVATGTGTFLYSVIDHIYNSLKLDTDAWSNYVSQHLLPRLLGFELLMAPYAVAHMKLGLQLAELGYKFDTLERLRVYLTNTLQEAFQIPPADEYDNWIRDEADAANQIKQEAPVMVVMGNPPYSGHSANNGIWISNLLRGKDTITEKVTSNYFEVDGKPLGERNPKWLNDDYVKFIRFAQWRIEQTGYGILAFITNHGFLDNPTFRGMRQSLMVTFDDIYLLDLHGNSKKKEQSPDGSKDENVFDIQQGVAISIFVKRQDNKKQIANIYHSSLYGLRDNKYNWLNLHSIDTTQLKKLNPQAPFYLFVPQNTDLLGEYEQGWKVTDIFFINSMGITTGDDARFISFHKEELKVKFENISKAITVAYRPFDNRQLLYQPELLARARVDCMRHFIEQFNLALITIRRPRNQEIGNFFVSDRATDKCAISSLDNAQLFPLYLYPNPNNPKELEEPVRPNLSPIFLKGIISKLGYTPTPEAIFYYIYAIFHSPTYRTRYAEFLKIDFPRVPLTSDNQLFTQLSAYGEELVALHLMKSPKLDNLITQFQGNGGNQIVDAGHPKYTNGAVIINKIGDKFTGVPKEVWDFYIGGYQVCQKWLKDRKGRTLTDDDIQHYQRVVAALQETIKLMQLIDDVIPEWPLQ
ncbi:MULTISPECIES: type ISP restriction/modification enzyme [Nostoc]|uniref:site-specific DNA-methyltransferase (adenine-specific) n=2 Tax=Nostoc TaxID=1177 RepID=A0ABR8II06_9NOSO|nr:MULTISPECIES: type ISP restriction/modification enzyme [Nostoc]MBD2563956.1 N-6 DNA methylase [Nostoc linckia FACHB-391]MBD2650456.1 N-6 DNA methylase [Nostoc foliaceum FACHB-393]